MKKINFTKKSISLLLICSLVLNMVVFSPLAFAESEEGFMIQNFLVDNVKNPIGNDNITPKFSWNMQSDIRGQYQTAYRIAVSSSLKNLKNNNFDIWDSGKIYSSKSLNIPFEGKTLTAATRYYWQVTVWDKYNNSVTSNETNFFETGLMESGWSNAEFIGKQPSGGFMNTAFEIEMDVTIHSGCASIGFGGNNKSNFYMWQINAYNNWYVHLRPHKISNGNYTTLQETNISNDIGYISSEVFEKPFHIKISVDNGIVKTYINNKTEPSSTVDLGMQINLGRIIFRGYSSAKVTEKSSYDNIIIKDGVGNVIFSEDFEGDECTSFNTNSDSLVFANGNYTVGYPSDSGREFWGIMNDSATTSGEAAPTLRKPFTIEKQVKNARLYATSAGAYTFFLNGNRVGDEYFAPGRTEYKDYILYQTYDVTDYLLEGTNVAGAILGHGWYNRARGEYGDNLALKAKLLINYTDGTNETVITDNSWLFSVQGPIIDDDIFNGEKYDARRELTGWNTSEYSTDSTWLNVTTYTQKSLNLGDIVSDVAEGIKIVDTIEPVAMTEPEEGVYIYDFGQNFAGVVEISATAPRGTVIKIRHGEALNVKLNSDGSGMDGAEGTLYTENLYTNNKQMKAEATDYYTFKGDKNVETYHPTLTQHGFRYIEITGIDEPLELDQIKGLVMSSAMENTGTFICSDEKVNRLYKNAVWSKLSNFLSVPIDCPQRSERMGWTGDAQIFSKTATYMSNCNNFYKKYLKDLFATQKANGAILDATPNGWINATGNSANGWGDAAIIIPYNLYTQYGDTEVITMYFDNMCEYVEHLIATSNNYIRNNGPYGDWMDCGETTPTDIVDTAYSAYACLLLSKMAAAIGKNEQSEYYQQQYKNFKQAWRNAFINENGILNTETQTAYTLGIYFDLFEKNEISLAAKRLVSLIEANGNKIAGGFLGLPYINPALSKANCDEVAYTLLQQDAYPSWLWPVTMQASTIWEAFYVQNPWTGMVALSYNHYAYGSIAEWMYTDMLGIKNDDTSIDTVGYKNIILEPSMGGSIEFAKGSYKSAMGIIESSWQRNNSGYIYKATVPANTTATLYLPVTETQVIYESGLPISDTEGVTFVKSENGKNVYTLESGSYSFAIYNTNASLEQKVKLKFRSMGVAIRTEGVQGIRVKTTIDNNLISNGIDNYEVIEYGTIAAKNEWLTTSTLTLDSVLTINGKKQKIRKGVAYVKDKKDISFLKDFAHTTFTGVLTGIEKENYNKGYSARSYVILQNAKGNTETIYGDIINSTIFDIANTAYNYKETTGVYREKQEVREYLYNNILKYTD